MHHHRQFAFVLLAFWLSAGPSFAQHAQEQAKFVVLEGLGDRHHEITTAAPQSQRFFDQGLRLLYGFNHNEAIRAVPCRRGRRSVLRHGPMGNRLRAGTELQPGL